MIVGELIGFILATSLLIACLVILISGIITLDLSEEDAIILSFLAAVLAFCFIGWLQFYFGVFDGISLGLKTWWESEI